MLTQPDQGPLYRQIYDRVRSSIIDGRLRPGDRLPPTRLYAQQMGVARGTVDMAYAILAGEGYVETSGRAGTRVAAGIAAGRPPIRQATSRPGPPVTQGERPHSLLPLTPGVPAFDLFPRKLWAQLVRRHTRALRPIDMAYPDPQGSAALREALAAHLAVSRGISCTPDEIIITGGYQAALGLVCRELVPAGAQAWVEDPGYSPQRSALRHIGAIPVGVPVDGEGLDVAAGIALAPDARLCVVAPAHQFPMGVALSLARRLQLLEWADRAGAWVLEDDYDGEFRYEGRPLPALKSLDRNQRVFYAGTFSKTLFPGMRLGYLVAPPSQLDRFRDAVRLLEGGRPMLDQTVAAEFVADGHFARHVKRMRSAYRSRRAALAGALAARFGDAATIEQGAGGLHLMLRIAGGPGRLGALHWSSGEGLGEIAMTHITDRADLADGVLVGFANVPERQAPALAARLHAIVMDR